MGIARVMSVVVLLAASLALAAPAERLQPTAGRAGWRLVAVGAAASVVAVASSVAAAGVALGTSGACTDAIGAPRPLCFSGGVALGAVVQAALSVLLIPELFRFAAVDPAVARAGWWRWARWPLFGLAAAVAALTVASGVEQARFASGQVAMMGALGGTLAAGLTVDVLGVVGAVRAAERVADEGAP